MSYVDCWQRTGPDSYVVIQPAVMEVFNNFVQTGADAPESGGILLGFVRGHHVDVIEATPPMKSDKRFRSFFERLANGHEAIAKRRWMESNGLVRYLGEWHTHPQDDPIPSYVDRDEWQKLAVKRRDERSVLAIIVGRCSLHLEFTDRNGWGEVLQPVPR